MIIQIYPRPMCLAFLPFQISIIELHGQFTYKCCLVGDALLRNFRCFTNAEVKSTLYRHETAKFQTIEHFRKLVNCHAISV